jgi:hypothetical protein
VLVQDVAWAVLQDTGDEAKQLEDLWGSFAERAPTILIAVDATRLTPEDLKGVADALRGKLDMLARVRGADVSIRVCLTRLDQMEGYPEIVDLLGSRRSSLVLRFADAKAPIDANAIERAFDPLRSALPRVLLDRPTPALRRAVAFFTDRVPELSRALEPFLRELLAPGPSARTPSIEGIYLDGRDAVDNVGEPFIVDAGSADAAIAARKRRILAVGAAVVGAAALVSAIGTTILYVHHRGQVDAALEAVDTLVKDTQAGLRGDRVAGRKIEDDERAAGERVRVMVRADASWCTPHPPMKLAAISSSPTRRVGPRSWGCPRRSSAITPSSARRRGMAR